MIKFRTIDFETTGLKPGCGVCEIGYTDVDWSPEDHTWEMGPTISMIVDPQRPMDPDAQRVHGISPVDYAGKVPAKAELDALGRQPVDYWVAHNAIFEQKFFGPQRGAWICTMKVSQKLYTSPNFKLGTLRTHLALPLDSIRCEPAHRAGPDTYVTAMLLIRLLMDRPDPTWMAEITGAVQLLDTLPFGKHRGVAIEAVPGDYLEWIMTQSFSADVMLTVRTELNTRRARRG